MFKQVVPISFPGQPVSVPDNTWLLWTELNGSSSKKAKQEASPARSPIWGKSKKETGCSVPGQEMLYSRCGQRRAFSKTLQILLSSFVFEMSSYLGGIIGIKKATCKGRGQRSRPCPPRRPSCRASGTFELCRTSPLGHAFECLGMRLQPC